MYTKIAHITDLHLDEAFPIEQGVQARERFQHVLEDIQHEGIQQIVCTGDIGEGEGIQYFFEQVSAFDLTITLGNHDSFSGIISYSQQKTASGTQQLYYSIQQDAYKCIYLDSSQGVIDTPQLHWLREMLDNLYPIIIFVHHPILGLDLKVDKIGKLQNRAEVQALLESTNKEVTVFCGHYHMESNLQGKNIRQYITPAVSYQIEQDKEEIKIDNEVFGYRIITINQEHISSKVKVLSHANQKTITR
ncbi:hypothetical protein BKI52_11060 [marine bacterium AO1-C]|nr:hypothetical protein BKI52_11060 [marine bacterium AO1-C]